MGGGLIANSNDYRVSPSVIPICDLAATAARTHYTSSRTEFPRVPEAMPNTHKKFAGSPESTETCRKKGVLEVSPAPRSVESVKRRSSSGPYCISPIASPKPPDPRQQTDPLGRAGAQVAHGSGYGTAARLTLISLVFQWTELPSH